MDIEEIAREMFQDFVVLGTEVRSVKDLVEILKRVQQPGTVGIEAFAKVTDKLVSVNGSVGAWVWGAWPLLSKDDQELVLAVVLQELSKSKGLLNCFVRTNEIEQSKDRLSPPSG